MRGLYEESIFLMSSHVPFIPGDQKHFHSSSLEKKVPHATSASGLDIDLTPGWKMTAYDLRLPNT